MPTKSNNRPDPYEIATDLILEQLDAGTIPWEAGWSADAGLPMRLARKVSPEPGSAYRGINVPVLAVTSFAAGYESATWGTYKGWQSVGGQVRKGERGTPAFFWKRWKKACTDADCQAGPGKHHHVIPMLRVHTVFNACQAFEDLPEALQIATEHHEWEPITDAERIAGDYLGGQSSLTFAHGGAAAFYSPGQDHVQMPYQASFADRHDYYSTLFHELTHSTGHRSRLARADLLEMHRFGDENYSREELVAEMGAAFLSAAVGIIHKTAPRSAAYLDHWRKVLRGDKKLIVQAAGQAQKAADLIRGVTWASEDDDR